MKAIIPVAGAGTRLRPLTYTQPKPLIPVAGKPIIAFIIDQLVSVGITDFVFVIGYLGEKIQMYVEKNYPNIKMEFVSQNQRFGLGHAIWVAREAILDADEVMIVLGDTIFDANLKELVEQPHSCLGTRKVDDPREFGVVELDSMGFISRVVEKPKIPKSNLAIVGLYKIKEVPLLVDALNFIVENNVKSVGEFQLTDALMRMIDQNVRFTAFPIMNWFDCGKREILLKTNATLLDREEFATNDLPTYKNTIVIPPVAIDANCKIENSIIGPHVTIGEHATIGNAIIRDSIIGNYTSIEEVVLHHSVVGSDAAIKGVRQSLNIGDNTEIDFS